MSIGAYIKKMEEAKAVHGGDFPISYVQSWHRHPQLVTAFAENIERGLQRFSPAVRANVPIVFTAHSLPERILAMNDPYPTEVRGTMDAVCRELGPQIGRQAGQIDARFAFQSQGRSSEKWLGPTVEETLEALRQEGHRHVLIAPIGFISDHVETLYDIDIEFRQLATSKGLQLERIPMLNASAALIDTLASVLEEHLASPVS
jgi:ferrochelatase